MAACIDNLDNRVIHQDLPARAGGATMVYDGDGNRVKKTAAGVTTTYVVADQNPTGYAQVVNDTIAGPAEDAVHLLPQRSLS